MRSGAHGGVHRRNPFGRWEPPCAGRGPADSWQAAPRLERRHTPTSALVGLRQEIMRPDGCLPSTSVICAYDATAVAATCVRQSSDRLSADGIVGPATYGTASRRLVDVPPWTLYRRTMSESGFLFLIEGQVQLGGQPSPRAPEAVVAWLG